MKTMHLENNWTVLDDPGVELVGLKVALILLEFFWVWWLGDKSSGRHAGMPFVWEYVGVCDMLREGE